MYFKCTIIHKSAILNESMNNILCLYSRSIVLWMELWIFIFSNFQKKTTHTKETSHSTHSTAYRMIFFTSFSIQMEYALQSDQWIYLDDFVYDGAFREAVNSIVTANDVRSGEHSIITCRNAFERKELCISMCPDLS